MIEIERKFLISSAVDELLPNLEKFNISQGYLHKSEDKTVRVRLKNDKGFLTIKGKTNFLSRPEYEYEIPLEDAAALLDMCGENKLEKTRYLYPFKGKTWEIDIFEGKLNGLRMAEIELDSEEESFKKPIWLKEEVSLNPTFNNSFLVGITDLSQLYPKNIAQL